MIEADRLTRRYGDFTAVDDVSFRIEPGEIVGLLGHNGAGKTTIMKMLTGALEPSSGVVRVDGTALETAPGSVQRQLGYLPESVPLYPELAVVDYLAYVAQVRRLEDAQAAVARAVEATDLAEKAMDTIGTLSRGYKQRLGVAQAILHEPPFLILDEPTNGLDPGQTQHMRQLVRDLAASATVILSTHIMQEVGAVCDRVLILRDGRLALDERLDDLRSTSRLTLRTDPGATIGELDDGAPASLGDGRWLAVEVKLGSGARLDDAARSLTNACEQIDTSRVGEPAKKLVITAEGYSYERSDGVSVLPVTVLGP